MNWKRKLTKGELKHLKEEAGCSLLRQVKATVEQHEKWRAEGCEIDPCLTCRTIGRKLGFIAI